MAKLIIKNKFATTPNVLLYDSSISFKAKGLYGYIQAKPDGWDFSAERISRESKEGLQSVRGALRELESSGYLVRDKTHNEKGFWSTEYTLLSEPLIQCTEIQTTENHETENQWTENGSTVNPTLEKSYNNRKKDSTKKELNKKEDKLTEPIFSMFDSLTILGAEKKLVNDWLKVRSNKKATDTETALKGFISQVEKSGKELNEILRICVENSWSGFNVSWLSNIKSELKPMTLDEIQAQRARETNEAIKRNGLYPQ